MDDVDVQVPAFFRRQIQAIHHRIRGRGAV